MEKYNYEFAFGALLAVMEGKGLLEEAEQALWRNLSEHRAQQGVGARNEPIDNANSAAWCAAVRRINDLAGS